MTSVPDSAQLGVEQAADTLSDAVATAVAGEQLRAHPASTTPARARSLTQRAGLTFASSGLQQAARLAVSLVATPIIVRGLGGELYGAWTMIQQASGYLALGDARPMGALKFALATEQHIDDPAGKRRQVGAALVLWLAGLPLLLLAGVFLVFIAPSVIHVAPSLQRIVQWTLGITVSVMALDRLLALPGNVLRALNLDYRAAGLNTAAILLGGIATVAVVVAGWGLIGLASASFAAVLFAAVPRLMIVLREVPWFGANRPGRAELRRFTTLGGWLLLLALGSLLLMASDLLVVGYILGPTAAAAYAMTGAALRFCVEPIIMLVTAGNAGIAGLCGQREFQRVESARRQMLVVGLVLFLTAAAGILVLNRSFVSLWVGPTFYAGDLTNVLLIAVSFQLLYFRTDSIFLDSFMAFREKTTITIVAGLLGLGIGAPLALKWGLPGMAIGTIVGRMVLFVAVPVVIQRLTGVRAIESLRGLVRPLLVGMTLLAAGAAFASRTASSWFTFATWALAIGAASAVLMVGAGLTPASRDILVTRARGILHR